MIGKLRTNIRMLMLLWALLPGYSHANELPKSGEGQALSVVQTGFARKAMQQLKAVLFKEIERKGTNLSFAPFGENPIMVLTTMDTIPSGSYIIDMGIEPQTIANGLKPYGLIWHLVQLYETPVKWSIDPNKVKDGIDFTYDGTNFKGGPFIVSAEYRTTEVDSVIQAWEAQGVVGLTTSSEIIVPIYTTLSSSIKWSLDIQNGSLAEPYFANAGIPTTAYDWVQPPDLGCCNDIFVLPHADPTWSTHGNLLTWNDSEANGGCAGTIWAGCRAVSELENIFNPSNNSERLNFLMEDPDQPSTQSALFRVEHGDGTLPPPYLYNYPAEPVMQFLGELDNATTNGSEEVYLPAEGGWRSTTKIGVYDDDHNQVPSLSPGPAAILAFGYAFGDTTRGMVMYEAGHRLNKNSDPANIAAQRAFFNFSFLATGLKAINVATDVPAILQMGQSYNFTGTVSGGSGSYSFEWTSDCPGNFTATNSLTTSFTPDAVSTATECIIQLKATDACGSRFGFALVSVTISPLPVPPVASDDLDSTDINTLVSIPVLANDSDINLDMDSSSLTLNGVLQAAHGSAVVNGTNYTIDYSPTNNFAGIDSFQYIICDATALCDTAMVRINVNCQGTPGQNIISGAVFTDTDSDGNFNNGETGYQGAWVRLRQDLNKNGTIDPEDVVTDSIQTASDGTYSFTVSPSFIDSTILSQRIIESSDDAMEKQGDIMESLTKDEVKLKSTLPYNGLRFQNITVPQGATITNAYLEFTAKDTRTGSLTSTIYGEKNSNSETFTSQSGDISERTLTNSSVNWNAPEMTLDLTYQTPNLSSIIQEIIDQANWSSGNNSITLIITTAASNERKMKSYDHTPSQAPLLVITYEETASTEYAYLIDLNTGSLPQNHVFTTTTLHTALFTQQGQTDCDNVFGIVEPEICDNGLDDDGDGLIDCNDPDCANYNNGGTISGDETACGPFDPSPITNSTTPAGGNGGTLIYSWQQSVDGGTTWSDISGATLESFDPGQIAQTTHYRRGARRFSCAAWVYSNSAIKVVLNNYTDGGTISGDESACDAFDPAAMTETTPPSGGTGTIEYQWQDSTANGIWADISGAVSSTYNPSTISATTYYRRGVRNAGCSPFLFSNIATKTVVACGNPEVEFCTYNLNLLYGDSFNIRDYLHVEDDNEPVNWSQITFTYTAGGANDPTNPVDWNLTAFNNGQSVTVSSSDNFSGSGNQGDGRYRIYVLRNGETDFDDKMTIRVENQSSDVNSAKCSGNTCDNVTDAGTVGSDETSCAAFDPTPITEQTSPGGGSGSLFYEWQQSLDGGLTWTDIINANSATFDPGTISQTTAYRRGVLRTPCTNIFYSNVVTKTISSIPTLTNDSFNAGCPGLNYSDNVALNDSGLSNPVFSIVANPPNGTVSIQNDGSFIYTPTNPVCGSEQFTYQVCNDNSSCCATATVTLILTDTENPAISNIPADITINCDDDIPLPAQVQVWENCTSISMEIDEVSTQGSDSCALYSYVLTRTWTVTDFCGNSNSGSQNITLEDITAPSIYRIYTLPNGRKLVAGVMENVTQRWKTILFPIHFGTDPLVFSQVVSKNEGSAVIARMRNISTSQFQLRLQEEENADGLHSAEKVAWIAIEEGTQSGSQPLETGKISAGNAATTLSFNQSYSQAPAFIESIQTFFEPDPAALRYENLSGTGTTIYLEEETSLDAETQHINETVGYLAIGASGNLLDQSGEIIGETGTIAVTNNLLTVNFNNQFHNPVIVLGGSSRAETDPVSIRVTNVTNSNFQVQVAEWDYDDGTHAAENLSYLVIEGSIPFDMIVECSAIPEPPELGTALIAVDNCDASVEITFTENSNSFNCATDTLLTRTWSVTDECGNNAAFTQTFILRDTTPPAFSVPADLTITCSDDRNDLQLTGDVLDENDNCTGSFEAVYTDDSTNVSNCLGTINRIWSLTDNCGNSISKTQTITLEQSISGVVLNIKVKLSGALIDNGGGTLMRDDLRANDRLPQLEPYTAISYFQHFGEGGLETSSQAVFDLTGNDAIVDWIMVELRNPAKPDSIIASRSALLQKDGDVVDVDGTSFLNFHLAPDGEYYIALRHRNHLGIMTSTPYSLSPNVTIVDFTDPATLVFGENSRVIVNGEMAMWAGDLNGDRKVIYQGPANDIFHLFIFTMLDAGNTAQLANYIGHGYEVADLNMDGKIIYQGPNNDRSRMLFYEVLQSPENLQQLANFILNEKLP